MRSRIFFESITVAPPSDITSTFNDISLQTMGVRQQEGSHFPATFGHMCGYDAKY